MKKKKLKAKPAKAAKSAAPARAVPPAVAIATRVHAVLHAPAEASAAFAAQTPQAARAALGERTRAKDTLSCVGGWIAIANKALQTFGSSIRYSPARLAFLCEATLTLADAMDRASGDGPGKKDAGRRLEALRAKAAHVRGELVSTLEDVVRGDEGATSDLAAVSRDHGDGDLVGALGKLAKLGRSFLDRAKKEPAIAALTDGVLSEDDISAATETAKALSDAGVGKADAGKASAGDTPAVNLAEGLVIAEMRVIRRAFERAHARDSRVPRLVPTKPLLKVFGYASARGAASAAPTPPAANANGVATTAT